MPKRGLPDTLRMRHDAHYVETLAAPSGTPVGRMVPIESVDPNPDQPRQAMGDLSELIASVTEKGIIEGKDFSDALFSVWLGSNPVDAGLKKALLGA